MDYLFEYIWLIAIGLNCINYIILKQRVQKYIDINPELKHGYDKALNNLLIYGNIFWLIPGIGNWLNYTNSIFDYIEPISLNPFILIFYGYIGLILILLAKWIYIDGGAEFLEKHPGFIRVNFRISNPNQLSSSERKYLFAAILLGASVIMTMNIYPLI